MHRIEINPDKTVEIPQVGLFYVYQEKWYVCLATVTHQEQDHNSDNPLAIPTFATFATILEIDGEGNDLGNPSIEVNSEELVEI